MGVFIYLQLGDLVCFVKVVDHNIGNASVEFVQVSSKIFVTEQVIIFIINGVTI